MPTKGHPRSGCGQEVRPALEASLPATLSESKSPVLKSWNLSLRSESGSFDFAESKDTISCATATVNVQRRIRHMSHRRAIVTFAGYSRLYGFRREDNVSIPPTRVISYCPYSIQRSAVPRTRTFVWLSFDAGSQNSPTFW